MASGDKGGQGRQEELTVSLVPKVYPEAPGLLVRGRHRWPWRFLAGKAKRDRAPGQAGGAGGTGLQKPRSRLSRSNGHGHQNCPPTPPSGELESGDEKTENDLLLREALNMLNSKQAFGKRDQKSQ